MAAEEGVLVCFCEVRTELNTICVPTLDYVMVRGNNCRIIVAKKEDACVPQFYS